jgi:hypothetical protein
MGAYVVVQLANRGTGSERGGPAALASVKAKRTLAEHEGILLSPARAADGDASTATIAVPDMARAMALADALRELDEVESAYAKPGEELP